MGSFQVAPAVAPPWAARRRDAVLPLLDQYAKLIR